MRRTLRGSVCEQPWPAAVALPRRYTTAAGNPSAHWDVVICGGGLVGAALLRGIQTLSSAAPVHAGSVGPAVLPRPLLRALLVDQQPALPTVFDPNVRPMSLLRTVAVTPMSARILTNLGAWGRVSRRHAYHRIAIRHEHQCPSGALRFFAGPATATSCSSGNIGEGRSSGVSVPPLIEFCDLRAPMGYIAFNDELQAALLGADVEAAAADANSSDSDSGSGSAEPQHWRVQTGSTVTAVVVPPRGGGDFLHGSIAPAGAVPGVPAPGGRDARRAAPPGAFAPFTASLLVGCDGGNSPVRSMIGSPTVSHEYAQHAFVASVEIEDVADGNPCCFQNFFHDGRICGYLPTGPQTANVVYSVPSSTIGALLGASDADIVATLNEALHALAPRDIPRITSVVRGPTAAATAATEAAGGLGASAGSVRAVGAFPLRLCVATTPFADRLLVVGDAAHAVHPMAGQGLNLGLYDVAASVDVFRDALASGVDIGSTAALGQIAARMFRQTAPVIAGVEAVKFAVTQTPALACFGMGVLNALGVAKDATFQHVASGLHLQDSTSVLFA